MGVNKSTLRTFSEDEINNLEEEPDYIIKTRSPFPKNWIVNLMVSKREEDLKNEAFQIARLKCHKKVYKFAKCEKGILDQLENGKFWTVFECIEQFFKIREKNLMNECFKHEQYLNYRAEVEMDKRRRDIKRNHEWWWRDLYDEDGEIGYQAEFKDDSWIQKKFYEFKNIFF